MKNVVSNFQGSLGLSDQGKIANFTGSIQYSSCFQMHTDLWSILDYGSVNKWNIESLIKYPTINYTAFGCNNMSKFFITKNRFVLNLKKWKNSRCYFPIDILLLIKRWKEIVWHLGPHPILNTTRATWKAWFRVIAQPYLNMLSQWWHPTSTLTSLHKWSWLKFPLIHCFG